MIIATWYNICSTWFLDISELQLIFLSGTSFSHLHNMLDILLQVYLTVGNIMHIIYVPQLHMHVIHN